MNNTNGRIVRPVELGTILRVAYPSNGLMLGVDLRWVNYDPNCISITFIEPGSLGTRWKVSIDTIRDGMRPDAVNPLSGDVAQGIRFTTTRDGRMYVTLSDGGNVMVGGLCHGDFQKFLKVIDEERTPELMGQYHEYLDAKLAELVGGAS